MIAFRTMASDLVYPARTAALMLGQDSLLKVDEVVRRMAIVEGQLSEKENDFADSRIVCSRIEGMMSAVQGREVQLDANVSERERERERSSLLYKTERRRYLRPDVF